MDRIKDLLGHSDRLTEAQRQALIKYLWLLGQAPEYAREKALAEVEPLLERDETEFQGFMNAVRKANSELARAINREPFP